VNRLGHHLCRAWLRVTAQDGQTLAEYGILVAVIAVVVVLAAVFLGSSITGLFRNSGSHI
jgi:Flp pilus assembly pilin Flp